MQTEWKTLSKHPIWILVVACVATCSATFAVIYQIQIVPLQSKISDLKEELNKHTPNAQKEPDNIKTSIDRSNIAVVANGNGSTVNVLKQDSVESYFRKFSTEKEINLPLLTFLSQHFEGNQIQELARNPKYLSVDVLSQYNQYEIDQTTLKKIMHLKNSLLEINKKIANLHEAYNKMTMGNNQEIHAIIDFSQVSQISNECIALYNIL